MTDASSPLLPGRTFPRRILAADDMQGRDTGAPVSEDYGAHGNAFNGEIRGVEISIDDAGSSDHMVSADEAVRVAMARQ